MNIEPDRHKLDWSVYAMRKTIDLQGFCKVHGSSPWPADRKTARHNPGKQGRSALGIPVFWVPASPFLIFPVYRSPALRHGHRSTSLLGAPCRIHMTRGSDDPRPKH